MNKKTVLKYFAGISVVLLALPAIFPEHTAAIFAVAAVAFIIVAVIAMIIYVLDRGGKHV